MPNTEAWENIEDIVFMLQTYQRITNDTLVPTLCKELNTLEDQLKQSAQNYSPITEDEYESSIKELTSLNDTRSRYTAIEKNITILQSELSSLNTFLNDEMDTNLQEKLN